jgi:hypothetical protein
MGVNLMAPLAEFDVERQAQFDSSCQLICMSRRTQCSRPDIAQLIANVNILPQLDRYISHLEISESS